MTFFAYPYQREFEKVTFCSSSFHVRSLWSLSFLQFGSLANIKSSFIFECTFMFLFSCFCIVLGGYIHLDLIDDVTYLYLLRLSYEES